MQKTLIKHPHINFHLLDWVFIPEGSNSKLCLSRKFHWFSVVNWTWFLDQKNCIAALFWVILKCKYRVMWLKNLYSFKTCCFFLWIRSAFNHFAVTPYFYSMSYTRLVHGEEGYLYFSILVDCLFEGTLHWSFTIRTCMNEQLKPWVSSRIQLP